MPCGLWSLQKQLSEKFYQIKSFVSFSILLLGVKWNATLTFQHIISRNWNAVLCLISDTRLAKTVEWNTLSNHQRQSWQNQWNGLSNPTRVPVGVPESSDVQTNTKRVTSSALLLLPWLWHSREELICFVLGNRENNKGSVFRASPLQRPRPPRQRGSVSEACVCCRRANTARRGIICHIPSGA